MTPHLLYNCVGTNDKYDVVKYITDVQKNINDFSNLGKHIVVLGGFF